MAESITEGTLKSWSKQVGDTVNQDDEVATIETDKIDVTVNAPISGKIVELLFNEEDTVTVGQDLFKIEPGEGGASSSSQSPKEEKKSEPVEESKPAESKPAPPKEEPAPPTKEEKKEAKESKKEEKKEKKEDKKKDYEAPKPVAGSRGETRVKMNRMRLRIAERLKQSQNAAASLTTFNEIDMSSLMDMRKKYKDEVHDKQGVKLGFMSAFAKACCLALREIPVANASIEEDVIVYRDYVDLSVAVATPKGLVTPVVRNAESMNFVEIEREIASLGKKAKESKKEEKKEEKKEKKEEKKKEYETPKPVAGSRGETRVKMNRMRLRIAERLKQSQNAAASLTTFNEIDMSSLMDMRKKYKDDVLDKQGVKLGFMSAFAKACCLALREIPVANASIEEDVIVYRDYVDLSVAVATPKGLVTPVVRNAESMNFVEIEREIASLGKKARDNKLTLEDMAGGTFTISNGGVFGSLFGTPIINLPQAAVLGMHAIKDRPVVVDGKIEIRPIMVVALTYDHRLLDGREAVTFLVRVKEYIEDPRKMLLAP
ncbi:unnamed protein product [Rhizoctonia solani]|uniref:dihydrolipoyllysine-residue succinyltransferase n=1 Tax=Rhizoctonia solani TaxID=456999 RepID=A0A8H3CY66_9AGAM|nr:unnamed protein product [Rhizoctonia solani]